MSSVRLALTCVALIGGMTRAEAQGRPTPQPQQPQQPQQLAPPVDSIAVVGTKRIVPEQVITVGGIPLHSVAPLGRMSRVQAIVTNLFTTGQFDDVRIDNRFVAGKFILIYVVKERPLLRDWSLTGPVKILPRTVREHIQLVKGRAIDRNAVTRAKFEIDSMYHKQGYYTAKTDVAEQPTSDGGVSLAFKVTEGPRVAVSRVEIAGNTQFTAKQIVGQIDSKPEGFLFNRPGDYDQDVVDRDLREALPAFYGRHGMIDFQVTGDTLVADPKTGKAILQITVDEGKAYKVGTFEILGNSRFSTDELEAVFPFGIAGATAPGKVVGGTFDQVAWEKATAKAHDLYTNNGYIQSLVEAGAGEAGSFPMARLRCSTCGGASRRASPPPSTASRSPATR